jgi:bifunctional DNA-binding transcriptional regulator/antitoxin component of YhaV-PrlF toxin-antitoxin module
MQSWQDKMKTQPKPRPTRVSRNGQVVLSAPARRAVGIDPGDLVVSVPVAPGVLLVEKVAARKGGSMKAQYEREDNPLRGVWGPDPDAWIDEIRNQWQEREIS